MVEPYEQVITILSANMESDFWFLEIFNSKPILGDLDVGVHLYHPAC